MGLDNLIDDEENESSNQTTKKSNKSKTSSKTDNFTSPRLTSSSTGPYGYESKEKWENTFEGDIKLHGDLFKYRLPIFSHIENEKIYNFGSRYKLMSSGDVMITGGPTACIYMRKIVLSNIPRELIMLDTGQTEKKDCYDVFEERFNEEVHDETSVYLYMFMQTRHITKMAIGDEQVDSWSTYPVDQQLKAIYDESYTQRFREAAGGPPNLKHTNQIGIWGTADEFEVDEK